MVQFSITEEIFSKFPNYLVVVIVAHHVDNRCHLETARALLAEAVRTTQERLRGTDPKELPAIAVWRQAFRVLGWSASTYQSSVESLLRRTLKGNPPPSINPAVDLANAASLRFLVPIGAHDLESAPKGLTVRPSRADDRFLPLNEGEAETPEPGEFVYAHADEVRTRRWVWRQSRLGLVTPDSRRIFFPIDAFRDVTEKAAEEAADWLAEQLRSLLGASIFRGVVDREHPQIHLCKAEQPS
ncbi:MAG: B3/4 domain-containing protein [Thermomicrobium sp.]